MRPQQQNRRMRGRNNNNNNNNNRKGPNPLTRNYESNGPDVKIRGSAHQIAEKYSTLARDAMSSGDRVMAENYLQHAEHYNRIIMAAQAQMPQQFRDFSGNADQDEDGEDERDEFDMPIATQPQQNQQNHPNQQPRHTDGRQQGEGRPPQDGSGPQPVIEGMPAEVALEQEGFNGEVNGANGAQDRDRGRGDYQGRGEGGRENRANGAPFGEGGDQSRRGRRPRRGPRRDENGNVVNGGNFGQTDGAPESGGPAAEAGPEPALAENE